MICSESLGQIHGKLQRFRLAGDLGQGLHHAIATFSTCLGKHGRRQTAIIAPPIHFELGTERSTQDANLVTVCHWWKHIAALKVRLVMLEGTEINLHPLGQPCLCTLGHHFALPASGPFSSSSSLNSFNCSQKSTSEASESSNFKQLKVLSQTYFAYKYVIHHLFMRCGNPCQVGHHLYRWWLSPLSEQGTPEMNINEPGTTQKLKGVDLQWSDWTQASVLNASALLRLLRRRGFSDEVRGNGSFSAASLLSAMEVYSHETHGAILVMVNAIYST